MGTHRGYMIEATLSDGVLTLHGTTKAARIALAGADHETDPVIPVETITRTEWKPASALANGKLVVHTSDGTVYRVHFRRKQQPDMEGLADALGVVRA